VEPDALVFVFHSNWRVRVGALSRRLLRRAWALALLGALSIACGVYGTSVPVAEGDPLHGLLWLPAIVFVASTGLAYGVTMLRRTPPRRLTFAADGIEEESGGKRMRHDWSWIQEVVEDDRHLDVKAVQRMMVFDKGRLPPNTVERLRELLETHARDAFKAR